ncbi:MAG: putative HTH-type transcriptional regulator [Bryobacteraceae bacterium]|nr:putative HTH-type transcriptional regulator [Bryobacteraceae bacterium]
MLSATVQHALRALSVLAGLPDGTFILGRDLAKQAGIPANYLSKILWTLGGAGFIDATRGSGGGYRLQKRPEEIHLADIVALFERHRISRGCLLDSQKQCSDSDACAAHRAWQAVGDAMISFLENTTLADIAPHQERKN